MYAVVCIILQEEGHSAARVYTIYGDHQTPMLIPPAFQVASLPNVGGVSAALAKRVSHGMFDSWLTVGLADGDAQGLLGMIGMGLKDWDATHGLSVRDGAIFWMNPSKAPAGRALLAQLTVPRGWKGEAVMNVGGRQASLSASGRAHDFYVKGVHFHIG